MNTEEFLRHELAIGFGEGLENQTGVFSLMHYPEGGEPAEKCVVVLGTSGGDLVVRAAAYDAYAQNQAVVDNEKTWLLGDVIEFFVQAPGREDYFEFHVTPEGRRLQLHLLDYRTFRDFSFESKCCDLGLRVKSRVVQNIWLSEMRIPFVALGISGVSGIRFAVCRYDYGAAGDPEMSSTMSDGELGFHNPPKWRTVE